jgi:hypothetical protein
MAGSIDLVGECIYSLKEDPNMTGEGRQISNKDSFIAYLKNRVVKRLKRSDFNILLKEFYPDFLLLGFDSTAIEETAKDTPPTDWELGECLAESYLEDFDSCVFPWLISWDKRHKKASLPGSDLVGFQIKKGEPRFVFGEVKTSSEKAYPPKVVTKQNDGLIEQVSNLINDKEKRKTLIMWLMVRCRKTTNHQNFSKALSAYSEGIITIYGFLVRDTDPKENDLRKMYKKVSEINDTYDVVLKALYTPISKSEWTKIVMLEMGHE